MRKERRGLKRAVRRSVRCSVREVREQREVIGSKSLVLVHSLLLAGPVLLLTNSAKCLLPHNTIGVPSSAISWLGQLSVLPPLLASLLPEQLLASTKHDPGL